MPPPPGCCPIGWPLKFVFAGIELIGIPLFGIVLPAVLTMPPDGIAPRFCPAMLIVALLPGPGGSSEGPGPAGACGEFIGCVPAEIVAPPDAAPDQESPNPSPTRPTVVVRGSAVASGPRASGTNSAPRPMSRIVAPLLFAIPLLVVLVLAFRFHPSSQLLEGLLAAVGIGCPGSVSGLCRGGAETGAGAVLTPLFRTSTDPSLPYELAPVGDAVVGIGGTVIRGAATSVPMLLQLGLIGALGVPLLAAAPLGGALVEKAGAGEAAPDAVGHGDDTPPRVEPLAGAAAGAALTNGFEFEEPLTVLIAWPAALRNELPAVFANSRV